MTYELEWKSTAKLNDYIDVGDGCWRRKNGDKKRWFCHHHKVNNIPMSPSNNCYLFLNKNCFWVQIGPISYGPHSDMAWTISYGFMSYGRSDMEHMTSSSPWISGDTYRSSQTMKTFCIVLIKLDNLFEHVLFKVLN